MPQTISITKLFSKNRQDKNGKVNNAPTTDAAISAAPEFFVMVIASAITRIIAVTKPLHKNDLFRCRIPCSYRSLRLLSCLFFSHEIQRTLFFS